eukprot:c28271_g1_i1.p1 GENE.c28271_g1_i1~~c28271_g1_i1.p1  ORF type:complete len:325 (+),score=114.66 c28271_g1_i1:93-1067(+)
MKVHWIGVVWQIFVGILVSEVSYTINSIILGDDVTSRIHRYIFNFLVLNLTVYFLLASYTDPGYAPLQLEQQGNNETEDLQIPVCSKCQKLKPPRCCHCSVCDSCILRFDHHCPWINNCVGFHNLKYFVLFLFWTTITCIYAFILTSVRLFSGDSSLFRLVDETGTKRVFVSPGKLFLIGLETTISTLSGTFVGLLFYNCFKLASLDMTAVENLRYGDPTGKYDDIPIAFMHPQRPFYTSSSKFYNLTKTFGPWYLWLIPTPTSGDGLFLQNIPFLIASENISRSERSNSQNNNNIEVFRNGKWQSVKERNSYIPVSQNTGHLF